MDPTYNEPLAAVIIGLLLSVAAGFRIMLPLLGVNLLAYNHIIALPDNLAWLGTLPTLVLLSVAAVTETVVHFVPAAGTGLKALATPLAFVAGTLLMAVPLGDKNALYQWTIAATIGGSLATLTHLGVTGARAMTAPVNVASLGIFGIVWNIAEFLISIILATLGAVVVFASWVFGGMALIAVVGILLFVGLQAFWRWNQSRATTPQRSAA